jgi:ABC-2 type transport system permease protein
MIWATRVLALVRVNLVRTVRDRTGFFFIFVLPFIIIAALGIQFGSATRARIGVVGPPDDAFVDAVVVSLETGEQPFEVLRQISEADVRAGVERGNLEIGLILPDGFADTLRDGGAATVRLVGTPESTTAGLRPAVEAAIGRQAALVTAARAGETYGGADFDTSLEAARAGSDGVPGVDVAIESVGGDSWFAGYDQFTLGAQTQLVLFVFMTSMTAAAQLVMSKQLGVSRRMLSTPTSAWTIIAGETLGRFAVALLQAVVIVVVSTLVFGVDWGDPVAAGAIVLAFGLVSAAVAMLVGAMSRNAEQAGSIGVFASLALAALGGCMVPLAFMPEPMQTVALLTPHAWAVNGLHALINQSADLTSVLPQVGVLLAYGVVLLALATWRFRRAITG